MMNKILTFSVLFFISATCFAQNNIRVPLTDTTHDAAFNFLLEANRPYPDVSSDMVAQGKFSTDIAASLNQDYKEFSVSGTYGLSSKINLTAMMTVLTSNYNLSNAKVNGIGDFLLTSRFSLGSSGYFSHYAQGSVKIPIAKTSDLLGTGKPDYHLGIVENFSNENLSCDLSASFDLLGRPDFPTSDGSVLQQTAVKRIDSVKGNYNFTNQPNYTIALYPSFYVNNDLSISTGADFTRDMQLNYNSSTFYLGVGLTLSEKALLSVGSSFNILNSANYYFSAVLSLDL